MILVLEHYGNFPKMLAQRGMGRSLTQELLKRRKRIQIFKYYIDNLIHNGMWSEGFCFPLYSFSKKILSTIHESLGESKKWSIKRP